MTDPKNKENLSLSDKYKLKGAQQMTYAQYEAQKAKNSRRPKIKIPPIFKFIVGTPFIIIFFCGIIFIPYMLYLIATSPPAPPVVDKSTTSDDAATR